jgi:hypothetical protein
MPNFGARYEPVWGWSSTGLCWTCRTCDAEVTDRYRHELDHRADVWTYAHVCRLYEIVQALFGEETSR